MRRYVKFATICQAILGVLCLSGVALAQNSAPPAFRVVAESARPDIPKDLRVKLVTDADFAPMSFVSRTGAPAGLAVELAIAACERAQLDCTVEARPFADILPALASGEADAAVTGPRLDAETLRQALATRPYFRTLGRFAVAGSSTHQEATPASLEGLRIGVVRDTLHARWLEAFYRDAEIVPFDTLATAGAQLAAGEIDALFGDNLQVFYWVSGEAAAGCCRLLDDAFSDLDYFSRDMAILVRRDRPDLQAAFDYGLDQAQASGATARILSTYVPLPLW
jgi:polar amino acid transport system substrate-binding protein